MANGVIGAGAANTVAVAANKKAGIHYAWYILASAVAISTYNAGLGGYAYSAFYKPWETEFGWTRGEISLAMSISGLAAGFSSPLFGRWTDQYGSRRVAIIGAILFGLAPIIMTATGVVTPFVGSLALPFLYVMFIVLSLGRSGTSNIPISTAVVNWFYKRRGLAMGIQSTGIGFGGVLIGPAMAFLITTLGWRPAFIIAGVGVLVIVLPINIFVLRNRPSDKGLKPYGMENLPAETGANTKPGTVRVQSSGDYRWTLGEAMRTVPFWCLGLAQGLFFFGNTTILQHALPIFMEKGESLVTASLYLSTVAGMGVVGKLICGFMVDRMSTARYVHLGSMIFQGLGFAILLVADSSSLYWIGAIVIGLSMGGAVALQPVMLGECFGLASFGTILGATSVVVTIGSNLGPLFAGVTHDLTGDYQLALFTMVILELLAGFTIFFARPTRPGKLVATGKETG